MKFRYQGSPRFRFRLTNDDGTVEYREVSNG